MDYEHARKAGNRGDVWKHSLLVCVADLIPIADDAECHYIDCHAGAPVHELLRGGEWERGVARALRKASFDCPYFAIAGEYLRSRRYPAGWVLVASRLARRCQQVHAALFDVAEQVAARYATAALPDLPRNVLFTFRRSDGFTVAGALEQADLVFLDPPFHPDADSDWRSLTAACQHLARRDLPFLAWYPFYWPTKPQELVDATACSAWEVAWAACGRKPSQNLKGCGLLVSRKLEPVLRGVDAGLRQIAMCLDAETSVRQPKVA